MGSKNRQRMNGFTLVEILVSLSISSILLAGFIKVFAQNQLTARLTNSYGELHTNARIGHHVLSQVLREAGHFGGVTAEDVSVNASLSLTGIGLCNQAWLTDTTSPVRGYDGANAITGVATLPANCIDDSIYVKNSDLLVVRYASPQDMSPTASLDPDEVYVRTIIGGTGTSGAEIFKGSDGASIGTAADPVGTYNYKYMTQLYYLKNCSIETAGVCQDETPALARLQIDGTTLTEHVLIEGVEQFQMEFGIDTDKDLTADNYVSPSAVANWKQVISVRFSLVIRGEQIDTTQEDNTTYALPGGFDYTPSNADKNYRRQVYTKIVRLRNMNRG